MKISTLCTCLMFATSTYLAAQSKPVKIKLHDNKDLVAVNTATTELTYKGSKALKVLSVKAAEPAFVKLTNADFHNGTIEVELAGQRQPDAHPLNRGFVGVAFRIADDNSTFECFYLRAANGRAEDQVQRNHTAQYYAHPDFNFDVMRKDFPEKYEAYMDMEAGVWTKIKIEVNGQQAKLYTHGSSQPTLIVNDLKLGADRRGTIGLWVGGGTDAHFANLKVTSAD